MIFQPLNGHVEIQPDEQNTIVQQRDTTFEERGVVMSVAQEVTKIRVGERVYFDSWLCSKFTDSTGKIRYLVPEENIRAVERTEWTVVHEHGG